MARPAEPRIREEIHSALRDGAVEWTSVASRWVSEKLGSSKSFIVNLLLNHLAAGEPVKQVEEKRELWKGEHEFHYDFILRVRLEDGKTEASIYVETRLINDSRVHPPYLLVANVHESN